MNLMDTTAPSARYLSLDAIRGIGVMGILVINIIAFAMPELAYINPRAYGDAKTADLGAWAAAFVLIDGKMRGLFSLLFGASMLLVIQTAEAKGENGVRVHLARMGWLLIFGLVHYYLIWFGDILFLYAALGFFAFLFRHREAENLIKWGILLILVGFLFWTMISVLIFMTQMAAMQPGADAAAISAYRNMIAGLGAPDAPETAKELAVYTGSYWDIVQYRTGPRAFGPLAMLAMNGLDTLGLMLIGMALLKNGFLTGAWSAERYQAIAIRCYLIGIPPMLLLAWWCWSSGFDAVITFTSVFAWALPFRILLVVAHAALALWLIGRFSRSALVARIAAAGRAAFSNYLGTSIVMTTIFYGYGFALFGEVSRVTAYLVALAGCMLMLLWSKPWLDRFAYGPLEWLWRSLARGKWQKMRRNFNNA